MIVVAYQGEPGSYSEEALWLRFAGTGAKALPCATFEEAVRAVTDRRADRVILPIANTVTGRMEAAVAAMDAAGLVEQDRFRLPLLHCLIGHPGSRTSQITRAYSQVEALGQCAAYLASQGIQAVATSDTAAAVREVHARGDPTEAAVGSRRAAALHRMQILERNIQDRRDDRTTFVIACRP